MYTWSSAMTRAPLQRLRKTFRLPQLAHERYADHVRAGLHRDAKLQSGVSGKLHVFFPLGIAGKTWLTIAGVTGRGGPALCTAPDREALQQLAIQANVELLRPAHALEVILILPLEANFDEVFAVNRKVVVNRDAAARSERQIFALPVILQHVQRNLKSFEPRTGRAEDQSRAA